jgi:hypothetical protein
MTKQFAEKIKAFSVIPHNLEATGGCRAQPSICPKHFDKKQRVHYMSMGKVG